MEMKFYSIYGAPEKNIHVFFRFFLLPFIMLLVPPGCTNNDEFYYTSEEANTRIITAYAINDSRCNMGHNITLPILAKVEKKGTDLCVLKILSLDCTAWAAVDPAPAECKIILTSFK